MTEKAALIYSFALPLAAMLTLGLAGCATLEPMSGEAPICWPAPKPPCPPPKTAKADAISQRQKLIKTAQNMMGNRYKYGGIDPQSGFDCSGFTRWVYKQHGIDLPRSSVKQFDMGRPVSIEALKPGDLVFFRTRRYNIRRHKQSLHVGIVTGTGTFIHSPSKGDCVREESFLQPYWVGRYIGARRMLN